MEAQRQLQEIESIVTKNSPLLIVILLIVAVVLLVWVFLLQRRLSNVLSQYNSLIEGVEEGNLEEILNRQIATVTANTSRVDELSQLYSELEKVLQTAVQRVGVIRFNPFEDTGGDQSFVVALLDAKGDGVVFSSLFSRTESRIFAKEIVAGKSNHRLTQEEIAAVEQAMKAPSRRVKD